MYWLTPEKSFHFFCFFLFSGNPRCSTDKKKNALELFSRLSSTFSTTRRLAFVTRIWWGKLESLSLRRHHSLSFRGKRRSGKMRKCKRFYCVCSRIDFFGGGNSDFQKNPSDYDTTFAQGYSFRLSPFKIHFFPALTFPHKKSALFKNGASPPSAFLFEQRRGWWGEGRSS